MSALMLTSLWISTGFIQLPFPKLFQKIEKAPCILMHIFVEW